MIDWTNIKKIDAHIHLMPSDVIEANNVNTDKSEHTARSSSACFPAFQCTLSAT